LVVFISVAAGTLIRALAPGFESTADAIWWAFLRLTDPGYLGDDEGVARATVSTAVTVLGYILFMGALVAILVQWLNETLNRLELGLTPIALKSHIVLLGWTSRTPAILQEIMISQDRVERFLRQRGARRLRVAILAEQANSGLLRQLRQQLLDRWSSRQIILRSGSSLKLEALRRVDFAHAAVIVVPAVDTSAGSALDADAQTVKTLMTMGAALAEAPADELPLMVVEIQDSRYIAGLRALYPGPLEVIAGDEVIVQLMVQTLRHPGLSHVYDELLSDRAGSQIYVRDESGLIGATIHELAYAFPEGILLGLVRPDGVGFQALLNPADTLRLESGDRVVVLASSYAAAAPPERLDAAPKLRERPPSRPPRVGKRRVLLLGWSHLVPALLREFASYPEESFDLDIVSEFSASKRQKRIAAEEMPKDRIQIRQLELDYTVPAFLEQVDPAGYDSILLLRDEQHRSGTESDAQTVLGYLLLRQITAGAQSPQVLIEVADPENEPLFEQRLENQHTETLVTPLAVSHMLARVAMRRELRAVFDELFSSAGCEITFRRIGDYDLGEGDYAFADIQQAADGRGDIAIGIRQHERRRHRNGGVHINPGRDECLKLRGEDELIVLSTNGLS
jgi:uncharacterized membrane protein